MGSIASSGAVTGDVMVRAGVALWAGFVQAVGITDVGIAEVGITTELTWITRQRMRNGMAIAAASTSVQAIF
ncbi:MAG: hypothetical protein WAK33_16860, partial [Silvibacterium sp.]